MALKNIVLSALMDMTCSEMKFKIACTDICGDIDSNESARMNHYHLNAFLRWK